MHKFVKQQRRKRNEQFLEITCWSDYKRFPQNRRLNRLLLGDLVYIENKGYAAWYFSQTKEASVDQTKLAANFKAWNIKWNQRLNCGWQTLWFEMNRSIPKNFFYLSPAKLAIRFKKNVYILAGNHSFDNDISVESKFMVRMASNKDQKNKENEKDDVHKNIWVKEFGDGKDKDIQETQTYLYPRFISVEKAGVKVEFLDLNLQLIFCVYYTTLTDPQINTKTAGTTDGEKYDYCSKNVINMYVYPTFAQAKLYLKRAKNGFSHFTTTSDWRAIRAHHNPFNNEDGDMNCFILKYKVDGEDYDFMGLMKSSKVKLIIASHTHNAQFSMINMAAFDAFPEKDKYYTFGTGKVDVEKIECFQHDLTKETYDFKTACTVPYAPTIDTIKTDIDNIHIFVIGNSGREFDPLRAGQKSIAHFIWGRAEGQKAKNNSDKYGGANFEFTKDKVVGTFFEVSGVVAKITIQNAVKAADYALLKKILPRATKRRRALKRKN